MLAAERIGLKSLPPDIARDWVTPDGRARIEILPKGDPNDGTAMRRFAQALVTVAPEATGIPIQLYQSERTVIRAFIEAGALAVVAIGIILWTALRRVGDVLLTLVPLLVAGLVTLELLVLFGMSLNFANVIALPLLLGVGVAFKIYYIMAWRSGADHGYRLRQPVAVAAAGLVEHGRTDGIGAVLHDGGGGVLPTGTDGTAAPPRHAAAAGNRSSRPSARSSGTGAREGAGAGRIAQPTARCKGVVTPSVLESGGHASFRAKRRTMSAGSRTRRDTTSRPDPPPGAVSGGNQ